MKSQLLISHCFLLIKQIAATERRRKNQVTFWEYPPFFLGYRITFCFNMEPRQCEEGRSYSFSKAKVALARRLAVIMHRMLVDGTVFNAAAAV